ncbi:MAG TPA: radical SAM protein [Chitinophagaceae bacterium]|nr:radical SAM protein [Chitinophagaceae bacterium]
MTITQSIYHTFQRYRTLQTDLIKALPVVILMPHSACNCRCVMCDIWKDNKNLNQLTEDDIKYLLISLKRLGTQQVLMSGGEALLNPNFFRFCEILKKIPVKITLLSTGLTLKKNAENIARYIDDIIISLDGDKATHNYIRNIPDAYAILKDGIKSIRQVAPKFRITARTVIHKINFRKWLDIINAAKEIEVDQVSFLPADVSSHAFNREVLWSDQKQREILLEENELPELKRLLEKIIQDYNDDFLNGFIAESPGKLGKIYQYYAAFYGHNPFPFKKCNAPWVSAVVEADGTVRPCFFHEKMGNIREKSLESVLNSFEAIQFRKKLNTDSNDTCKKCVCYLNLSPGVNPGK